MTAEKAQDAAGAKEATDSTTCKTGCPSTIKIIITVKRKYNYKNKGTPGTLEAQIEGEAVKVSGFTTEQPPGTRDLGHGDGKKAYPIAAGTYPAHIRKGGKRNGTLPKPYKNHVVELENVKGTDGQAFNYVQIHTGLWPKHSAGCIIFAGSSDGNENIGSGDIHKDSIDKNKELVEFVESMQAKYGAANVGIEVRVIDPPAGSDIPPDPEPTPKKKKGK